MKQQLLTSFFFTILAYVVLSLSGCQQQAVEPQINKETVLAFGTFVEVTLVDLNEKDSQIIFDRIQQDLTYMHTAYHPWKAGPTGRLNQLLGATGTFSTGPDSLSLLSISKQLSEQSQGLFNPAMGKLVALWGYHEELPPEGPPPAHNDIQQWLDQKPSMDDISIKGVRVTNQNPAVKLDFGAVAKGYALNAIMKNIQRMGVKHAVVNTGGDLKVLGQKGNQPWHIGIRDPRSDGIIASIDAKDGEAIFTSGDYERSYQHEGKRYHHILDPRTGYPATSMRSVTIIHKDAARADAAATALFVAGPKQWMQIAKSMQIELAMLIDAKGHIQLTPQMQHRVQFEKQDLVIEVVELP